MNETTKQVIGGVAFVLNVWGNLELTKQTNRGHVIRLCSNACWLVYSPLVQAWALLLNHTVFAYINVLGFYRWHKIERSRLHVRDEDRFMVERLATLYGVSPVEALRRVVSEAHRLELALEERLGSQT